MKIKTMLLFLLIFFMVMSVSATELKSERTLNLTAEGITLFDLDCQAGSLKIQGVDGLTQLEVHATIVVKGIDKDEMENFIKDNTHLSLKKEGNRAVLISSIKSRLMSSLSASKEARIDLAIRIPKKMALSVKDSSGSVDITAINGNIKLDDGSGSIEITDINGDVEIEDGSGSIQMKNIGGNVTIEDGSGEINVKHVGGDVSIDDNSGELTVNDVKGNVIVDDGSGSIKIDGVEKDVTIKNDGSGSVSIHNVKGKVKNKK